MKLEETNWATVENVKHLEKFRLMDDTFFMACFHDNKKGIQFLLRTILHQPKLKVIRVNTQYLLKNLRGRDAYLDVYAKLQDGRHVNLEIQRSDAGANPRRARYHASLLDMDILEKGKDPKDLPDSIVIFITENDVRGEGQALYYYGRTDLNSGKPFDDGSLIMFVNGSYQEMDEIGMLMKDMNNQDWHTMYNKELAKLMRYYKETQEGGREMCRVLEEVRKEEREKALKEGRKEGCRIGERKGRVKQQIEMTKNLIQEGSLSLESISKVSGLAIEKVKELKQTVAV